MITSKVVDMLDNIFIDIYIYMNVGRILFIYEHISFNWDSFGQNSFASLVNFYFNLEVVKS